MNSAEFLTWCCEQLSFRLRSNATLKEMTKNSGLIGQYAEASIREFIKRFIQPLQLGTGSIVYEENFGGQLPQLDGIIWQPCPLPPIVEAGEFVIVPRVTGLAYLEIKRSNYSGIGKEIKAKLSLEDQLVPYVAGENAESTPDRSIGVVCLFEPKTRDSERDSELEDLVEKKRVAVILRRNANNADLEVDGDGIARLSEFLMHVRARAKRLDGTLTIRYPKDLKGS